jgi:NAD(P)-dependent dehydrogenase (short-subunit alcohol dehydrogenase family)
MHLNQYIKKIIKTFFDYGHVTVVIPNITMNRPNEYLKGRCALITGGTSGIGYSIAKAFLDAGAKVIITGRDEDRLKAACKKLGNDNRILGFVMDNANVSLFENKFEKILNFTETIGIFKIDILVNNAGINCNPMPNATEEEYDKVMDTNLKGTYFLSQIFGRYMIDNDIHGNILNIASASSLRPANSAYILSKWGLRGLTMGLAKSLGEHYITVNGIAPGPTATPMMIKNGKINMSLNKSLLGRYIMPEEIANMAVVLVSDIGRSVMGDVVYMTGGAGILTYDDVDYSF